MALYEDDESALFTAVNDIPKSDIEGLVKQYSRVLDNFRPVNLLRYDLLNQLKEGNKLSSAVYEDIKEKIRGRDSAYFRKYGTTLTESLVQYPYKKKDLFTAWKNPFRVLCVFIYRDKLKSDIEDALQKLSEEIENRLDLHNFSSNRVSFDGATNFGSSYCWLALYPNTKLNHQRAYQLFLRISGDQLEAGLIPGWKIEEPEPKDVKTFNDIENALLHLGAVKSRVVELNQKLRNYWKFAPGPHAVKWDEFYREGIMAISWEKAKDLNIYTSTEELAEALGIDDPERSNEVFNIENFRDASIGDIVVANRGKNEAVGIGVIEGAYEYHPEKGDFSHVRKVNWLVNKPIPVEKSFRPDTFSPTKEWGTIRSLYIAKYPELATTIKQLESGKEFSPKEPGIPGDVNHWWLNANPKIWNFVDAPVGSTQTYTTHNEKGNKRRVYKYFQEVKPGDIVIGYISSPNKEIAAEAVVTKGLHQNEEEGERIEFKKTESFINPISLEQLKQEPALKDSEPLVNNQGSLFKLSAEQYEIIRGLIDDANPPTLPPKVPETYTLEQANAELFIDRTILEKAISLLTTKKNIVLQGPPGVGKTFFAKRLAFAALGRKDNTKIQMIQFHQSYSYEDFIQGYRPTPDGKFELKNGVFYTFCRQAQLDEKNKIKYFFIIDEINRGNLSKIFGELMMLVEFDKRDSEFALPLTYAQSLDDKFYIPENLYLIGTMNTADRSLAMVDYALRRRFCFIDLPPAFGEQKYLKCLADAGADESFIQEITIKMVELNTRIEKDKNLGKGFKIGHSYFCPQPRIKPNQDWFRNIVFAEIEPLLKEYWFDNPDEAVKAVETLLA